MKKVVVCHICGKTEDLSQWINANEMHERQMCFECNFWQNNLEADKTRKWAVINGGHYVLESHTDGYFKGFGGQKFIIRFFDGHIEECDNLWHQGEIPEGYWREQFPDNAEFIPKPVSPVGTEGDDLPF